MKLLDALTYLKDQVAQIEVEIRLCCRWQEEREFRITASKFGLVIKRHHNHNTGWQSNYCILKFLGCIDNIVG